MRGPKVAQLYRKAGILGAVLLLSSLAKVDSTRCIKAELEDTLAISEAIDIKRLGFTLAIAEPGPDHLHFRPKTGLRTVCRCCSAAAKRRTFEADHTCIWRIRTLRPKHPFTRHALNAASAYAATVDTSFPKYPGKARKRQSYAFCERCPQESNWMLSDGQWPPSWLPRKGNDQDLSGVHRPQAPNSKSGRLMGEASQRSARC